MGGAPASAAPDLALQLLQLLCAFQELRLLQNEGKIFKVGILLAWPDTAHTGLPPSSTCLLTRLRLKGRGSTGTSCAALADIC